MKFIKPRCVDTLWWFTSGGPHLRNCFVKASQDANLPPPPYHCQNKQRLAFVFVLTSEGLHDVSSSWLYYWGASVCVTSTGCETVKTYISSPSPLPKPTGLGSCQPQNSWCHSRDVDITEHALAHWLQNDFILKNPFKKCFISLHRAINWATFISKRTAIPLGLGRLSLLQQFKKITFKNTTCIF